MANLVMVFVFWMLIMAIWNNHTRWRFAVDVWKGFSPARLGRVTALICLVLLFAKGLVMMVPGLMHGWGYLIGHHGNIILMPLTGGAGDTGTAASGVRSALSPPPTLYSGAILLVLAIPFIAEIEERVFRKGREAWPKLIGQAMVFGPLHLIAGIPVAGALALILPGLWYGYRYRTTFLRTGSQDEAILDATREHAALNTVVIGYIFLVIAYAGCGYCAENGWLFFR